MLEHGRWANGSSSGFWGANAVGLDAIVSPPSGFIFLQPAGSASVAQLFNAADLEYGALRAAGTRNPPNGHFLPHVFGEALGRKAVRLQTRDRRSRLFVDENVLPVLL